MTDDPWVVVGLGNPGPAYARTLHNVGYLACDVLVERLGSSWRSHKSGRAQVVEGRFPPLPGPRVVVGRARSYMNESGGPVAGLLGFYKVPPERLVVIHDELDLPLGSLRVKLGGGDNGHNGLRSIRASLGSGDYYRVRVGVGRPTGRRSASDHVLAPLDAEALTAVRARAAEAADAVESLLRHGLGQTQQAFNS